jgi:hypothetical protein
VILWLLVIDHARRTKHKVTFVSCDNDFTDEGHSLHPDLQSELRASDAEVAYYWDLGELVTKNSLAHFPLTEDWLNKYLPNDTILEESRRQLEQAGGYRGTVKDCTIESLSFEKGSRHEVSKNAFYVEAAYRGYGSVTVERHVIGFSFITRKPTVFERSLTSLQLEEKVETTHFGNVADA